MENTNQNNTDSEINSRSNATRTSNGRNKRRNSNQNSNQNSSNQAASCGIVENPSSFSEKIRGEFKDGYKKSQNSDSSIESSVVETSIEASNESPISETPVSESTPEVIASNEASNESRSKGPAFENIKRDNRVLEVSLENKKNFHPREKQNDSTVSYISASIGAEKDFKKKKGAFARIKDFIASIFGKKKKKKFSNDRRFNNDRRGKFNKRRNFDKKSNPNFKKEGSFQNNGKRKFDGRRKNNFHANKKPHNKGNSSDAQ